MCFIRANTLFHYSEHFVSYYINTLFYVVQTKRFILHERSVLYCRNKVFITMN